MSMTAIGNIVGDQPSSASAATFRVVVDGDLLAADGTLAFRDFNLHALAASGVECVFLEPGRRDISAAEIADCDALILFGSRFTPASIPSSSRFTLVARAGVGYDNIDVAACSAQGIGVTIAPDGVRRPVAVSILTLMLALTSRLMVKDHIGHAGGDRWSEKNHHTGISLTGRTLGSIGFGNIARDMFRLATPFDMRFMAVDPSGDAEEASKLGVALTDLDTVLGQADVLAVNCPLSNETRGLVGAAELSRMKPSAFLINTARGPIVDQAALVHALAEGRIAGAGLDVLEQEPPDPADPILHLDNVIVTPHALCWTDELFRGLAGSAATATLAVMRGTAPRFLVDPGVASSPLFLSRLAEKARFFGKS